MNIRLPDCFHTRQFEDAWYWQDAQETSSVEFFRSFVFHDSILLNIYRNVLEQRLIVVLANDTHWNKTRLPLENVAPGDDVFIVLKFEDIDNMTMTGEFPGSLGSAESWQLTPQECETLFADQGELRFRHAEKIKVVCFDSSGNRLKILTLP
jgi:hypothetical protein